MLHQNTDLNAHNKLPAVVVLPVCESYIFTLRIFVKDEKPIRWNDITT